MVPFHLALIFRVSNGHNRGSHAGYVFEEVIEEPLIPSQTVCSGGPNTRADFVAKLREGEKCVVGLSFESYEYTHPLTHKDTNTMVGTPGF